MVLVDLAVVHSDRGELAAAQGTLEVALALGRDTTDPQVTGRALATLGELRRRIGDLVGARAALEEATALLRPFGSPEALGEALCNLARLEAEERRPAVAAAWVREAGGVADALGAGPDAPLRRRLAEVGALVRER